MTDPILATASPPDCTHPSATSTTRLGFVGLGNIGAPMAGALAHWPAGLTVFDLDPHATAQIVDRGATAADSLADLAATSDIIGICVRDDHQVGAVVDELLTTAAPGTIIVVHSTISPHTATQLAESAAQQGVSLLDAPISGGAAGAASGRLALMVGGPRAAFEAITEPMASVADLIVHAGEKVGSGTSMKLARNLLHFISFTATAEAQRLAAAAGLDLGTLGKVVRHSDAVTGGAGAIMVRESTADIAPDEFWYPIFTAVRELGEKDLALAYELGAELGLDLPMTNHARRELASALGVPHQPGTTESQENR